MSFEIICPSCGAVSGPSVGICPFCKSVMSAHKGSFTGEQTIIDHYQNGRHDLALMECQRVYHDNQKTKLDISFLILYAKILIEAEGPSSQINSILAAAAAVDPKNSEVQDYLDIMKAKSYLMHVSNDLGEQILKKVLQRSPDNLHALFLMGTHLYWTEKNSIGAIGYLEKCIQINPRFLRAWGCLAMIYKSVGNQNLCQHALRKCVELESNPTMKELFNTELKKVS